jgi:hypothetical protein
MTAFFDSALEDVGSVLQVIFGFIIDQVTFLWRLFLSFFLDLFGKIGNDFVSTGDIISNSFQKQGLASFNNFFYAIIGVIFLSFAIKAVIKLVIKALEIIGNYIPFT